MQYINSTQPSLTRTESLESIDLNSIDPDNSLESKNDAKLVSLTKKVSEDVFQQEDGRTTQATTTPDSELDTNSPKGILERKIVPHYNCRLTVDGEIHPDMVRVTDDDDLTDEDCKIIQNEAQIFAYLDKINEAKTKRLSKDYFHWS